MSRLIASHKSIPKYVISIDVYNALCCDRNRDG